MVPSLLDQRRVNEASAMPEQLGEFDNVAHYRRFESQAGQCVFCAILFPLHHSPRQRLTPKLKVTGRTGGSLIAGELPLVITVMSSGLFHTRWELFPPPACPPAADQLRYGVLSTGYPTIAGTAIAPADDAPARDHLGSHSKQ